MTLSLLLSPEFSPAACHLVRGPQGAGQHGLSLFSAPQEYSFLATPAPLSSPLNAIFLERSGPSMLCHRSYFLQPTYSFYYHVSLCLCLM